jgi:hypothetical protein
MLTRITATILIAAVAVVLLPGQAAYAGDKEWATAGKILAGVVGAAIIHEIVTSDRNDRAVVVHREYPAAQFQRVRYVQSPQRTWVPGHFETRIVRTWVEGYWEQVWVPAEYQQVRVTKYDAYGRAITYWKQVLVNEAHFERVWHEGFWQEQQVQEWVPGCWIYR